MKISRRVALLGGCTLMAQAAAAETMPNALPQDLNEALKGVFGGASPLGAPGGFTSLEADTALREALSLSAKSVVTQLSALDGFYKDLKIHIPLPGLLGDTQRALKPLGLAGALDDLELKLNRGAETAMPKAKVLFLDAIKAITIQDAIAIVRGPKDAATSFLRDKTSPSLIKTFSPIMGTVLKSSGVHATVTKLAKRYSLGAASADWSKSVTEFATTKAIDGAFLYIAQEEAAIRSDPAKRTTAILRKVFGAV